MELIRYRPENSLSILETLHDEIDELFNFPFSNFGLCKEEYFSPSLDVYEDKDNVYVEAELPGLEKKDIKISLKGRTLAISGRKEEENKEKKQGSFYCERLRGNFYREIGLTQGVDASKIKANYAKGVLQVTLPKKEEEKEKTININVN